MDICDLCTYRDAVFLCLCASPFPRLCAECTGPHASKAFSASHSLEPIAAKAFLISAKSIPAYMTRKQAVSRLKEAACASLSRVSECKDVVQSILSLVFHWGESLTSALENVENTLRETGETNQKIIEAAQYLPSIPNTTRLHRLLLEAESMSDESLREEMSVFDFSANVGSVSKALETAVKYETHRQAYERRPGELVNKGSAKPISKKQPTETDLGTASGDDLKQRLEDAATTIEKLEEKLGEKNAKISSLQQTVHSLKAQLGKVQSQAIPAVPLIQETDSGSTAGRGMEETDSEPKLTKIPRLGSGEREVHPGVQCDGCSVCPIVGPRWSCEECGDFDFCDTCYQTEIHAKIHTFAREKSTPIG